MRVGVSLYEEMHTEAERAKDSFVVVVTMALQYNLRPGIVTAPSLLLFRTVLKLKDMGSFILSAVPGL